MTTRPAHQVLDREAFTLVELLISMALLTAIAILLTNLLGGVNRVWIAGEQRVENFQAGRAIVDLIARELSQAIISPRLQFVQDPTLPAATPSQAPNSNSLFWQAPLSTTQGKNVCEVGYYLARDDTNALYQLKRFFVPPTDTVQCLIYNSAPSATAASWVTNLSAADFSAKSTIVSDGVLGLWFRCFDANGEAIPWLYSDSNYTASSPIQFNSAACFQWTAGYTSSTGAGFGFTYTNPASTVQAHRLPCTVEITVLTVDSTALLRKFAIPAIPAASDVNNTPTQIADFNVSLLDNKIKSARTFTTRVNLVSAQR